MRHIRSPFGRNNEPPKPKMRFLCPVCDVTDLCPDAPGQTHLVICDNCDTRLMVEMGQAPEPYFKEKTFTIRLWRLEWVHTFRYHPKIRRDIIMARERQKIPQGRLYGLRPDRTRVSSINNIG